MASISAIYAAILNKLTATPAVTALVSTRIRNMWSTGTFPTYPALVFGMISETEPAESGVRAMLWQFSAFDSGRNVINAHAVIEAVRDALDQHTLSATGWTIYEVSVQSARVVGISDAEYAHVEVDVMIFAKPS